MTRIIFAAACCVMMVFDIVSGLLNAIKRKEVKSSKMREGLWHKCGFLMIIGLGFGVEYVQTLVDLGLSVPLVIPICTYIIIGELISVLENINKIADGQLSAIIKKLFGGLKK